MYVMAYSFALADLLVWLVPCLNWLLGQGSFPCPFERWSLVLVEIFAVGAMAGGSAAHGQGSPPTP